MRHFTDTLIEAYFDQETYSDTKLKDQIDKLESELKQNEAQINKIKAALKSIPSIEARIEAEYPDLVDQFNTFTQKRRDLRDTLSKAERDLDRLYSYSAGEWDPQGTVGGARYRNELSSTYSTRISKAKADLEEFEKVNAEMVALINDYWQKYDAEKQAKKDELNKAERNAWELRHSKWQAKADMVHNRLKSALNRPVESLDDLNAYLKDWTSELNPRLFYDHYEGGNLSAAQDDWEELFKHAKFRISTEYLGDEYNEEDDDLEYEDEDQTKDYLEIHFEDDEDTWELYENNYHKVPEPLVLDSNLTYKKVKEFLDTVSDIMAGVMYERHLNDIPEPPDPY